MSLVASCRHIKKPDWSDDKPATSTQLAADVDSYLSGLESDGLAAVVLMTHHGTPLLHKAYGLADRESGRPMAVETGFCIGSIVKPITKAAILKLESAGKLNRSDTLPKYFNHVPPDKVEITLQQVVDHKAGFPDIFGDDYELVERDLVVNKVLGAKLISKPGEEYNYSNSGFSLLGAVIEKVSGLGYEEYVYNEILKPAGATRIGYLIPGWKNDELAVGYERSKRWGTPLDHAWMKDGPSWNLRANGGMIAATMELHQAMDGILNGRAMSEDATRKYRDAMLKVSANSKRVMGPAGGNGIFNAIYVNWYDDEFVFILFTSVDRFAAEDVFPPIKDRIKAFLK